MKDQRGRIERAADRYMPYYLIPFWQRLKGSTIGYRLAHGAFWSTLGAGLFQFLMLLTSIVTARLLGRVQFGEYGVISSTVGMFSVFAGFGLGTTATKYVAEFRKTNPIRAGRIIALSSLVAVTAGFIGGGGLFFFAPWLAIKVLAAPHLADYLRLASGIIFLSALNGSQVGALAGFEAFKIIARINLVSGITAFPLIVGCVYAYGLSGAVAGQAITMAITCVLNAVALRRQSLREGIPTGYVGCTKESRILFSFSLPAVLSGIMVAPINWACTAILVNQSNGYSEMGVFNAASSWQKAILFLPSCIGAIALPMLSSFHGEDNKRQYRKALWYNLLVNAFVALVAALIVSIFSVTIMTSYGPGFASGYPVLILLSCSAFLVSIGSVVGNVIASTGKMWFGFKFNLFWAVIYIATALFFVPKIGAVGLALSLLIAYVAHTVLQTSYSFKILKGTS